jgi:hypothetical protein
MLQVFYEQAREVDATKVVPSGAAVPVHMGIEEAWWAVPPACMRSNRRMRTTAAGGAGPAYTAAAACGRTGVACLVLLISV